MPQQNDFQVEGSNPHVHDNHQYNVKADRIIIDNGQPKPQPETVITYHAAWRLNQTYLPRKTEMNCVREKLFKSNILQIRGIGGLGKTSLCCQLFRYYLDNSGADGIRHLGWISYSGDLKGSIYKQINTAELTADEPEAYLKQAGGLFNRLGRSLLLFIDNADDITEEDIAFLRTVCCCVILTARYEMQDIDAYALPFFSPEVCMQLYREHSGDRDEAHTREIGQILELAGCHTQTVCLLARTQKKSYKSAGELLDALKKSGFSLKGISVQIASGRPEGSAEQTFTEHMKKLFDIAKIREKKQLRALRLFSLLAPNQPLTGTMLANLGFDINALNELIQCGWLETNDANERYIHPVIAATVRAAYPPKYRAALPLIRLLTEALENSRGTGVAAQGKLLPHCVSVADALNGTHTGDFSAFLDNTARIILEAGNYAQALEYAQWAVDTAEQVHGKEHLVTAKAYNNIGLIYYAKGDYDEALKYYRKALAIQDKKIGIKHSSTATTYNNIACVYQAKGQLDKALEYLEKALAIKEKVHGKEHPDTATSYNNIASVYQKRGDLKKGDLNKALEYYEKSLAIQERKLGTEHPNTAIIYHNIASVYDEKGKYDKALEYYEKALTIREKKLGIEHPDTVVTRNCLASLYYKLHYKLLLSPQPAETREKTNIQEDTIMTTAFAASTITTLATVLLKPVIANYLPAPLNGDAGDALTEWLSEHLGEQLGSRFGREQTLQDKLANITQTVFDRLNAQYDGKFSEFPAYVKDNGISISNRDDMTIQLKEWRKQKTAVTAISDGDINNFVNEFFAEVTAQIENDSALKEHLAILKTEAGVKLLLEEMAQLKKQLANGALPQNNTHINEEIITMVEENMKKEVKLEHRLEISGGEVTGKNYKQENKSASSEVSMSTEFKITGGKVNLDNLTQSNISGTE